MTNCNLRQRRIFIALKLTGIESPLHLQPGNRTQRDMAMRQHYKGI